MEIQETPRPSAKRRPSRLRSVTGLFGEHAPGTTTFKNAAPSNLPRTLTFTKKRMTFRLRSKKRDHHCVSMDDLSRADRAYPDPPPEYSLLGVTEQPQGTGVAEDASPRPSEMESHANSPMSLPEIASGPILGRLRNVAEADALDVPSTITEHVRSDHIAEEGTELGNQSRSNDREKDHLEPEASAPETPQCSAQLTADNEMRHSNPSDEQHGCYELLSIHKPSRSLGDAASSLDSGFAATAHDNAEQLTQARVIELDAQYACTLALPDEDKQQDNSTTQKELRQADDDLNYIGRQTGKLATFTKSCQVCHEPVSMFEFPTSTPTSSCIHTVNTCSCCLRQWIIHVMENSKWACVTCPECRLPLSHNDIHRGLLLRF